MAHWRALLFIAALLTGAATALGDESLTGKAWIINRGGKLYDNLWIATDKQPPTLRNPLYPRAVTSAPGNSWRCVSCHGWDYRGAQGHLVKVGKFDAFTSLRKLAGKPARDIAVLMQSGEHGGFVRTLTAQQLDTLAVFVSAGQHDTTKLLAGGKATGSADRGKDIFEGACVSCHRADGKAYIQGESGDRPALGWVALNRPEQALHKIRNGVPGTDMLALRFLEPARLADLLAYLQTLDPETD